MPRAVALAFGLILLGGLSAGCGGGSTTVAVRQEARQLFNNGNPEILRIESVRDLGGNQLVIATLKGHFRFPLPNGPCGAQCRHALRTPRSYIWLSFSQSHPKDMYGYQPTSASAIAAIDNAHSARKFLSVFPDSATTAIRCAIPRGDSSATVAGSCSTTLVGPVLDRSSHVTAIRFHEAWSFAASALGYPHQTKAGGWVVALDRHEHVQSIRRFGDLPPQLWK